MKGAPRAWLFALVAVVLALHLLLLSGTPGRFRWSDAATSRALVTRTITPAATTTPAPAAPVGRTTEAQQSPAEAPQPPRAAATPESSTLDPRPATAAAASTPLQVTTEPNSHPILFRIPSPARLNYTVTAHAKGVTLSGAGTLLWRHDGASYQAQLEISASWLPARTQSSTGKITEAGLAPVRFANKNRTEEAAHFDHERERITFSNNQPDAPLAPGAQDRLSVVLQLAAMVGGEPAMFSPGTAVEIQTAGTRDAEPWTFTVDGPEQLNLPGGTVSALKLTRNPRKEFDQKVELWLSPGMDYVPVRLRLTQPNGDWVDQQWSSTDKG